jgi:DNA-binding NarL/FixJ family response regulator
MTTQAFPVNSPIRVLIADDHPVVRAGLRFSLSAAAGYELCGEAENADEACALAAKHAPRLIILDLNLGGRDGDKSVSQIRQLCPQASILVFSMNPEELFAERALREGANGYLMKTDGFEELHRAVRQVLAGEVYLSERLSKRLAGAAGGAKTPQGLATLTGRELQIFQRIGEGRSTAEIAAELGLSMKTISAHRENVKRKLGVPNAAELIRQAVAWVLGRGNGEPKN